MQNPLVRLSYCMPLVGSRIKDIESKYYVALRHSVHRDLGATIAANPSTVLAIARLGDREKATLIRDFADGSIDRKWDLPPEVRAGLPRRTRWRRRKVAARLEAIVKETGRLLPRDYWPNLGFLANWTGGTMGAYLRGYPDVFGERPIRDVGLIASEGRVSIPIEDGTAAGLLDIRHHYFEFIPEDQAERESPGTCEASELIEGKSYFILLTTAGGLYRYQIHDLVRCVGFQGRCPLIEFLSKGAHFSSMTGEKLSEFQVVSAINAAQCSLGLRLASYLLLPVWGEPPLLHLARRTRGLARRGHGDPFRVPGRGDAPGVQLRVREPTDDLPSGADPVASGEVRLVVRIPEATAGEERRNGRTIQATAPDARPHGGRLVPLRGRAARLKGGSCPRVVIRGVRLAEVSDFWYSNPAPPGGRTHRRDGSCQDRLRRPRSGRFSGTRHDGPGTSAFRRTLPRYGPHKRGEQTLWSGRRIAW